MPLSTSISALKSLFPVRARQEGGYDRFRMPNPNDPRSLYGMLANPSGDPSHVAGGMSSNEYNALQASQAQARTEGERQSARNRGGLAKVVQGLKTVPTDRNWDAFFGALDTQGVSSLETGAAAGMDMGPSTYDMKTGASYQRAKPGFFDTQAAPQRFAQDPRTAQAGDSSAAFQQHQARLGNAPQMALSGLRQAPYDPSAPVPRRLGSRRSLSELDARVQAARQAIADADPALIEEREREKRAAYLDAQDAKIGRTNVRRR